MVKLIFSIQSDENEGMKLGQAIDLNTENPEEVDQREHTFATCLGRMVQEYLGSMNQEELAEKVQETYNTLLKERIEMVKATDVAKEEPDAGEGS